MNQELSWDYYLTLGYLSFLYAAICFYGCFILCGIRALWRTRGGREL